jgi:hypothetical protein
MTLIVWPGANVPLWPNRVRLSAISCAALTRLSARTQAGSDAPSPTVRAKMNTTPVADRAT